MSVDRIREYYTKLVHDELWRVQLEHYPDSIELHPSEMLKWALDAPMAGGSFERQHLRFRAIAMTIQYPGGIFYCTKPSGDHRCIGYRYGMEGSEYLSSFSDL